jgi:hypothetical protein
MACNGFNHSDDCQCGFRGGHAHAKRWKRWSPREARHWASGPNAYCPKCHAPVFFVPFGGGRGTYFDTIVPTWKRHPCTDARRNYSPYNKQGVPKLRNRRSEFEKNGWTPFFIRNVETLAKGMIVHGVAFDSPTVLHFGFCESFGMERTLPIYFRMHAQGRVEVNFFTNVAGEIANIFGFDDCFNEMELLLKSTSDKAA